MIKLDDAIEKYCDIDYAIVRYEIKSLNDNEYEFYSNKDKLSFILISVCDYTWLYPVLDFDIFYDRIYILSNTLKNKLMIGDKIVIIRQRIM